MPFAFLLLLLAGPALGASVQFEGRKESVPSRPEAYDEFAFIGWGDSCSAALSHLRYPPIHERRPGEPKSWRIGKMTIPPAAKQPSADWLFESRKEPYWDKGRVQKETQALRKTHREKGFTEDVRPAPVAPRPGLAELLTTTAPFKTDTKVKWPPASFRLSRVHYHPLGLCALLVFSQGARNAEEYRYHLIRLLNPGVRRDRSEGHAVNGRLLYDKSSDPEAGAEELAIASSTDPRYAAARYDYALLLSVNGRFDEAVAELEAAVRLEKAYAKLAKKSIEFDNLRYDKRFIKIVGED